MFEYSTDITNKIVKSLSEERLSTYLSAISGNLEEALKLYLWNSEISAAFYVPVQGLEITLRNSLHDSISAFYKTDDWFGKIPVNPGAQKLIRNAKNERNYKQEVVSPCH